MTKIERPLPCPDCEEGMRETSRHGGNDPDTWLIRCETCDGAGIARCHAPGCRDTATHAWIRVGDPAEGHALLCARHHAAWLAEVAEEEEA
jgi:hypothetical protein